jgi:hypothetical protein
MITMITKTLLSSPAPYIYKERKKKKGPKKKKEEDRGRE